MTNPILRLNTDELLNALDAIDPVDVLVEELVGQSVGGTDGPPEPDYRLSPWVADDAAGHGHGTENGIEPVGPAAELLLLDDLVAGGRCVMPSSALYVFRTAALATLAARELVAPGVVTAAVLGSGFVAQASLSLIARNLFGLSHVAVCPDSEDLNIPLAPRVVDQLDLAGVGWLMTTAVAEAVFGATLIVATIGRARWLEIGQLPKGAVLINTTGEDLPDDLVDAVDQIYVDDATLIEHNPHRYFARKHLGKPTDTGKSTRRASSGRSPQVVADLTEVLTGAHPGRTHVDHILLVELLGARVLDARLAGRLHRAALERGLGIRLVE